MISAPTCRFTVRLLPPIVTTLCFAAAMSSPIGHIGTGELLVLSLLQFSVSYITLSLYALLCQRIFPYKWPTILAPLSLLIVPLPLYGLLYGVAEWSGLPLLSLAGGDGVFNMVSWVLQLSLFAVGMIFTGHALLKGAPRFPQSWVLSLLCALAGLIFGSIFFLYGSLAALTDGDMPVLHLMLPPGLLFVLPPLVFLLRALRKRGLTDETLGDFKY